MAKQITIDELEKYLWGAAVDLRGQISATAYKDYVFPLLFFKRICDVRDEEYEKYEAEGGKEYAEMMMEESTIKIPSGAHWQDVFNTTENIGQKLVDVFRMIEHANPAKDIDGRLVGGLEGIFGDKTIWTNKSKMPDNTIRSLLNNFNKLTLSLSACPADEMGTGYEYLIGKFADDAGHTAQEFYTNRTVVELMAEILQLKPHESIYDPTCGSGGMLIKSLTYLKDKGEEWRDVKVYGQEINSGTASIARMNLYLHGIHDFSIVNADTLENPAFIKNGKVQQFDVVLANPPYSISTWNREKFTHDKFGRCFLGVPPQSRADYAFIQHILASMNEETGRCAVLLPHGVLNRNEEKDIRINHISCDTIDAVIGLGRNLFFNSGLESFILICRSKKVPERKGKILFIEAEQCAHKEGKQAYLFEEDILKIIHAYNNLSDEPGFSKWVLNDEIVDGNLNIKSYVKPINSGKTLSVKECLSNLLQQQTNLRDSFGEFEFCKGIDYPLNSSTKIQHDIDYSNWKTVKLGDVASERSSRIDNPSESQYDFFIGSDCISQYDFTINKRGSAETVTSAQKEFRKGDYLLVRRSLYGSDFRERAPRADFDGCCSADILTIQENPHLIYDGYLLFVLYSKPLWDYIVSNSTGGLTRRIKWKQLANFEFRLPPKNIQKELSDKLWAAYELKQSYIKMIEATDEMVKSQFIEMFYGGKYPLQKLEKNIDVLRGVSYKPSDVTDKLSSTESVILRSNNIDNGAINYDDLVYVNSDRVSSSQVVSVGDIVMCGSNGSKKLVGKAALIDRESKHRTSFGAFCLGIRCKETIHPKFLATYFQTSTYRSVIEFLGSGSNILNIKPEHIYNLEIPIPEMDKQKEFVAIVEQADKSKFELKNSIAAIDKVIKSLINENL